MTNHCDVSLNDESLGIPTASAAAPTTIRSSVATGAARHASLPPHYLGQFVIRPVCIRGACILLTASTASEGHQGCIRGASEVHQRCASSPRHLVAPVASSPHRPIASLPCHLVTLCFFSACIVSEYSSTISSIVSISNCIISAIERGFIYVYI